MTASSFAGKSMTGLPLAQVVTQRMQSMERPMPPVMLLSAAEISPLVTWLGAGALPDPNGCVVRDPRAGAGAAGTGQGGAPSVGGAGGTGVPVGNDGATGWPMFGGDLGNTRANTHETTLTTANVAGLKELWTFRGAAVTATPAVAGGVAYLPTWSGQVVALDARTGAQRWMTKLPDLIDSSPALSATQVFVSDDQGSVHALERTTGKVQWSKLVDKHAEAHLWSSPIYLAGSELVLVGVASGEEAVQEPYSFRGNVAALDAKTGEIRWQFYTTTADAASGPGVAVWATVAVDEKRKVAYVGTGNAYSGTPGKYVDSMLALKYETGELLWAHQFTMGDVFSVLGARGPDFDIGASANLFTAGGKDLVGIGIKSGDYATLDRDTGEVVWTAHISKGSVQGGMIASPAFADNKVFVASNTYPNPQTVTLAALDAATGKVAWMQTSMGAVAYGGVVYANGVIYVGVTSSAISAYEASTGKQLWTAMAPDSIAGGPSVANGVLYVPWGYMWTLREGGDGVGGLTAYGLK
jgi:polyvinyl alcohol dehydrogenase (cytochrome)